MSDFALGAIGIMLVQTFLVFVTAYAVIARDCWRDSKLPPREQINSSPLSRWR